MSTRGWTRREGGPGAEARVRGAHRWVIASSAVLLVRMATLPAAMATTGEPTLGPEETRGPMIHVISPARGNPLGKHAEVFARFEPRQAPINLTTVKVTLLRMISIDITDRIRPYLTSEGIRIPSLQIPAGQHRIRISVADVTGFTTVEELVFISQNAGSF